MHLSPDDFDFAPRPRWPLDGMPPPTRQRGTCMTHFVVVGGGSWGAAIASSLQRAQQPVTVLARDQQTVDMLIRGRCPKLSGCAPIAPLAATTDPNCLTAATMIFVAVPVQANAESFDIINTMQASKPPAIVALCAKGVVSDKQGGAMLLTTLAQTMIPRRGCGFSGPALPTRCFPACQQPLLRRAKNRHQSHTRCF